MAFEFLLIAMIDGQQPITLQRYEQLIPCQEAAMGVDEFVKRNYNELKRNPDFLRTLLLEMLAEFNAKWETLQIPVPSIEDTDGKSLEWAEKIKWDAFDAHTKGLELKVFELASEALR